MNTLIKEENESSNNTSEATSHVIVNDSDYNNDTKKFEGGKEDPSFGSNLGDDYSK